MISKLIKFFLCCMITVSFAQENISMNIKIDGMHCAGGCAKYIEASLNQNEGVEAVVDFNNSMASIEYDTQLFSGNQILDMINGYRDGKFTASFIKTNSNDNVKQCSKGKNCCQKTGKLNPTCDNKNKGCCAGAKKKKKRSSKSTVTSHVGCQKSCCSP